VILTLFVKNLWLKRGSNMFVCVPVHNAIEDSLASWLYSFELLSMSAYLLNARVEGEWIGESLLPSP
jgi:hypothetical protein